MWDRLAAGDRQEVAQIFSYLSGEGEYENTLPSDISKREMAKVLRKAISMDLSYKSYVSAAIEYGWVEANNRNDVILCVGAAATVEGVEQCLNAEPWWRQDPSEVARPCSVTG
jgi:hypothetical protein